MRRLSTLAMFAVLVGCKSQQPPKPMDCEAIVPPAIERIMSDFKDDPRVVAVLPQAKSEMVAVCTQDKWSGVLGKCIAKANTRSEMDQCRGAMNADQSAHVKDVNARLRGAIEQSGAQAPAPTPEAPASGSGSAGSASGSGSSGKAATGSGSAGSGK